MRMQHCDDIFLLPESLREAVCITTNGVVKADGRAVMGKGIALEADQRFKLAWALGQFLGSYRNHAYWFGPRTDALTGRKVNIIAFPTKQDWRDPSDLELIKRSCWQVTEIANKYRLKCVYLPKPGCSNGGLDWESQVYPAIEPLLDDRFIVADKSL